MQFLKHASSSEPLPPEFSLESSRGKPASGCPVSRYNAAVTALIAASIFLSSLMFFAHVGADVPILRELRGYIYYGGWVNNIRWFDAVLRRTGSLGSEKRIVIMLFMGLERNICGFGPRCLNHSQDILLATAVLLLFLHVVQLFGSRRVGFIVSMLWCLSLAALEGALWQDTQFDKFAMIFGLLYLITLFHFLRRPVLLAFQYLVCNLLLLLLLFLAFKSKEFTFFLVPTTFLVLLIDGMKRGWKRPSYTGLLVLLPMIYGLYFIGYYMLHVPEGLHQHISSGKMSTVIPKLSGMLLGYGDVLGTGNWGADYERLAYPAAVLMIVTIVLIAISFVAGLLGQFRLCQAPSTVTVDALGTIAYLLGTLLFQMIILARTLHPAAYYLLLPEGLFLSILAACAHFGIPGLPGRVDTTRRGVLLGLLSMSVLLSYLSQRTSGSSTYRMQYTGKIINDSYAAIRVAVPPEQVKDAEFYFRGVIDGEWYLFYSLSSDNSDPELLSFVYEKLVPAAVTYTFEPRDPTAVVPAGRLQVVWRTNGSIQGIYLGGRAVFTPTW